MKKLVCIACFLVLVSTLALAQTYSNKIVGEKNSELLDSLKQIEYPYALPIWGEKVTQLGFDLPYSAGLGINYLWQESDIEINNLRVGFNHGQMFDLDQIVRFNNAIARSNGINIRPDLWLFPFLNVYGIFARSNTSTEVDFGVWVPGIDISLDPPGADVVWREVFNHKTKAEFEATSFGFGLTPTVGVGGGWMALDMNFTWTDIDALEKPAFGFVFGPRFGKTFKFKNPQRNLSVWVGGFRVKLSSGTNGSLNLTDIFDADELESKVDAGLERVEENQQKVDEWWDELNWGQQQNPVNKAKYALANKGLESAANVLVAVGDPDASVQYSLDKKPKNMWNFIVGSQFQLNKSWMIRGEVGFLGSRTQVITGLQYRFGL